MFIAVYRFTLKPGTAEQYRRDWAAVTEDGIAKGGSFGSSLGQAQDGSWVAVARWPSKQKREDWPAQSKRIIETVARMRQAIERRFDDLEVEIVDDLTV